MNIRLYILATFNLDAIGEANGISIAVMGMLIVFCALGLIFIFIGCLPRLMVYLEPWLPEMESHAPAPEESLPLDRDKIIVAIATALKQRQRHN